MKRSAIIEIICFLFIVLFLYTGAMKWLDFHRTWHLWAKSVLIGRLAIPLAFIVPFVELSAAVLLVMPKTRLIGLYTSLALMVAFTFYVGYMLAATTSLQRPCSCGGVIQKLSWPQHLYFNIFFVLLAGLGVFLERSDRRRGERRSGEGSFVQKESANSLV